MQIPQQPSAHTIKALTNIAETHCNFVRSGQLHTQSDWHWGINIGKCWEPPTKHKYWHSNTNMHLMSLPAPRARNNCSHSGVMERRNFVCLNCTSTSASTANGLGERTVAVTLNNFNWKSSSRLNWIRALASVSSYWNYTICVCVCPSTARYIPIILHNAHCVAAAARWFAREWESLSF